uniref:Uncharacterized protein n=1 Tax=Myotis myotis TaxID=51298 RepID=A0A7J7UPB1_MYOMY|nr:hypothetical protein mMyoMyo1_008542 [Myotis myotis]
MEERGWGRGQQQTALHHCSALKAGGQRWPSLPEASCLESGEEAHWLQPGLRPGDGTRAAMKAPPGFPGTAVLPAVTVHPKPVSSHAGCRGARRAVGAEPKSYGLAHQGWQCPCPCCWARPTEPSSQHQLRARRCQTGKRGRQGSSVGTGAEKLMGAWQRLLLQAVPQGQCLLLQAVSQGQCLLLQVVPQGQYFRACPLELAHAEPEE